MPLIVVALITVPLAELWVIVEVAQRAGVLNTIALLLAVSLAGAWLLKQQGLATWARLRAALARGEMPAAEVTDGAMILFGGALLLTPGFLTDVVGLLLLLPPTRALIKRSMRRFLARWARRRYAPPGSFVYEATVVSERRREASARDRLGDPDTSEWGRLGDRRPGDGDGSPDRG